MTLIDKILNEWAFRCHDGVVDINNPEKVIILNEILLEEGIFVKDNDVVFSASNNISDLLHTNLKDANLGGVYVNYSIEYNQENPNGSEIKDLADKLKELDLTNEEEEKLRDLISKDIEKLSSKNFKPKTVYYLESSAPLSKMIGDIIKDSISDVEVLPLNKIKFPSWEDMLVPDYKDEVESEGLIQRIESAAKKMWETNEGVIKSSKLDPSIRKYFKPKYNLEDILEKEKLMFVDDNVQTGADFKSISDKFFNSSKIMFYAAIKLTRTGAKTTKASRIATSDKIPFEFSREDLIQFPFGVGVKSTYNNLNKLRNKGYISKAPTNVPNKGTYYLFNNTKLTIDDLI